MLFLRALAWIDDWMDGCLVGRQATKQAAFDCDVMKKDYMADDDD